MADWGGAHHYEDVGEKDGVISPRVRMAARLYSSGACKTKKEASLAAGLHPNYLTLLRNNPRVNDLINKVDAAIGEQTVDMSKVLVMLGRQAVRQVAAIMTDDTVKPDTRLKAAQDLADRSPETSKTQKLQMDGGLFAGPELAKELAAAMVANARIHERYAEAALGDYITVDTTQEVKQLPSGEAPLVEP